MAETQEQYQERIAREDADMRAKGQRLPQPQEPDPYAAHSTIAQSDPYAAHSTLAKSPVDLIDYARPVPEVRAQIAKLPPNLRPEGLKRWATLDAQKERDSTSMPLLPQPRVPIASAAMDHVNAAIEGGANWALGNQNGNTYDEALARYDARNALASEAHPVMSAVGNVGAGLLLPVPKPVQTAFSKAAPVANAALQGAKFAGGVSATDAALQTRGSLADKAEAALKGGVIGVVVGGVVGAGVAKIGQWWADKLLTREVGKYFDQTTGKLTPAGEAAAQAMGADPADMVAGAQQQFAKTYAMDPTQAAHMVQAGKVDFDIPQSLGQATKNPAQLIKEKAMRAELYGKAAQNTITNLDNLQATKVAQAAQETIPERLTENGAKLTRQFAGGVPFDQAANGQLIQRGVKAAQGAADAAETAAWDAVPVMTPTKQAIDMLPGHLSNDLAARSVTVDENTAVAAGMVKRLGQFVRGESPVEVDAILSGKPIADVDRMRRQLLGLYKTAQGEDLRAAKAVYESYNDWIERAASNKLLSGSPDGYAKLIAARDVTKATAQLFSPSQMGHDTAGARVLKDVLSQDTPENIVNALFLGPKAGIRNGSVEAIQNIKQALTQHVNGDLASETWSALKIAHWSRIVQGKNGELLTPQQQLTNIKTALNSQETLMRQFYRPQDLALIRRYASQLEQITWKDPNPSGTATGLASLTKELFGEVMSALGTVGKFALKWSGAPEIYGNRVAQQAVRQNAPTIAAQPLPAWSTSSGALGAGLGNALNSSLRTEPQRRNALAR